MTTILYSDFIRGIVDTWGVSRSCTIEIVELGNSWGSIAACHISDVWGQSGFEYSFIRFYVISASSFTIPSNGVYTVRVYSYNNFDFSADMYLNAGEIKDFFIDVKFPAVE